MENYNVTYAETIMPACDLSEQISTASKEASGTGNMKFMMNGAVTIGTLDGANVEINELVGEDNIFIFGLTAEEVNEIYQKQDYKPYEIYESNETLKQVIDQLVDEDFFDVPSGEFKEIYDRLMYHDNYLILKDFASYEEAHRRANERYKDRDRWTKMSIVNIAKSGKFSSDRTIKEYANEIWHVEPIK